MRTKGFTLIELLVVIAIIGILASITIASIGGTRANAKNKAMMQQMNSLRTQAQLYFSSTGTYGSMATSGLCNNAQTTSTMLNPSMGNGADQNAKLISKIAELAGNTAMDNINTIICYFEVPSYAIAVKLLDGKGVYCIDYRDTGKLYTTGTLDAEDYIQREAGTGIIVCI